MNQVRKELIAIRDKVNVLLDAIDGAPKGGPVQGVPGPPPPSTKGSNRVVVDTTPKPEGMCVLGGNL